MADSQGRPKITRKDFSRTVARALHYVLPYKSLGAQALGLILLATVMSLLAPWPLKIVVDSVLNQRPLPRALSGLVDANTGRFTLLMLAVGAGFSVTLVTNALSVFQNYVNTRLHECIVLDFRSDLFKQAQRLSLAYHDQRRTGQMIFAINSQGASVAGLLLAIPPLIQSALTLVGMFWVSFKINSTLALLSLSVVPLIYGAVWYYMTRIQQRLYEVRKMEGASLQLIHEVIQMLRVVVAFGRESYEFARFREQSAKTLDQRVMVTVQQTAFSLAVNTSTALGTGLVLFAGSYYAIEGKLTVGQLLVVLSYISMIYHPLEQISTNIGSLTQTVVSMRIACELLDLEPEIVNKPDAKTLSADPSEIVFEDVSFHYSERPETLKNISFRTRRGQVIGLVGPTGAGKTTLINLIPRFYEVTDGHVRIDGIDVRDLTIESLRRSISIVLQDPLLFAATITENIRYGRLDATMDEIVEAAKAANAHDFIERLPKKYDTVLGERGSQLSGGERQRISVARAFLKNAPILILDEPTSSVDSKTEGVILDALDRLMIGRTTFMVAHRLSTIRHADTILVLNRGAIVDAGTHEELIARDGLYKQLYEAQSGQLRRRMQAALSRPAFDDAVKVQV
jgi:ATP-binding cassette subfamily B protein